MIIRMFARALVCVALLSQENLQAAAPIDANGTWLLQLRRTEPGFELVQARWASSAKLDRAPRVPSHTVRIRSANGSLLWSGTFDAHEHGCGVLGGPFEGAPLLALPTEGAYLMLRVPAVPQGSRVELVELNGSEPGALAGEFVYPSRGELHIAGSEGELITLFENGPRLQRINIVVMGDGFTAADRSTFTNQARITTESFLGTAPMSSYGAFFNAYAIFTASAEAGSDHPSAGHFRDTYFNSSYENSGISYLITIPPNSYDPHFENGRGKVSNLLADYVPEYDIVLMIVNDTEYGGSGGFPAIASLNPSSSHIMIHELGHSFAGLGDEYTTPYPGYPDNEEPNTTRETRREFIKWNAWIEPDTPVPTPGRLTHAHVVGLFEGAHYHSTGWYRPKLDCKMRSLGAPFCEVCSETLVLEMHRSTSTIAAAFPETNYVRLQDDMTFSVELLEAVDTTYDVQWQLNRSDLTGAPGTTLHLSPSQLTQSTNMLVAYVRAATAFVRNDPAGDLLAARIWMVERGQLAIRLADPRYDAPGTLSFEVTHPVEHGVLEASEDLLEWVPVSTNRFAPGERFSYEAAGEAVFLRIVELP